MATLVLGTYLGNKILDLLFNDTNFDPSSASIYLSLHSGDPSLTGANELSGNGYARVAVSNWSAAGSKTLSNGAVINFPTATGAWSEATYIGIFDASTSGNFWGGGALTASKTAAADEAIRFDAGEVDITF